MHKDVCVTECVCASRLIIHGWAVTPSITLWNSLLKAPLGNSFSYIYTVSITPFNWYIYLLNGLFYSSPGHKMWNICAGVLHFLFCSLTMLQATFYWSTTDLSCLRFNYIMKEGELIFCYHSDRIIIFSYAFPQGLKAFYTELLTESSRFLSQHNSAGSEVVALSEWEESKVARACLRIKQEINFAFLISGEL